MHPRPMSNTVKNAMPSLTFVRVAQSMANLCVDDPANGKVGNRGQWAVDVHVIGCSSVAAAFSRVFRVEGVHGYEVPCFCAEPKNRYWEK